MLYEIVKELLLRKNWKKVTLKKKTNTEHVKLN